MDQTSPSKALDRDTTCPFLLRTFVKVNGYHSTSVFENNRLPVEDEYQIYTWKDANLRELVTYLRSLPPSPLSATLRHPAARYSFRLVFPDPASRGRIATKDLGSVHAKDIATAASLTAPDETEQSMDVDQPTQNPSEERNLDELRVVPGDWLLVAVYVPTKVLAGPPAAAAPGNSLSIRGAAKPLGPIAGVAGRGTGRGDIGWGTRGRGGGDLTSGNWRGRGSAPSGPSGGGRGGPGRDADRPRDRRPSPVGRDRDRRPSPTGRDKDRDKSRYRSRSRSPSRSKSRSRSPPRRRRD